MIRIYKNLHKNCYSIQEKINGYWKVTEYSNSILIKNCTFKIYESGRQRVIKEKIKNVHAYVYGDKVTKNIDISNLIKIYQDGLEIGKIENFKKLYKYNTKEYYYLGVGNPSREIIPNFFKGYIDGFAQWDKVLTNNEILDLSKNETKLLNKNFGNYNSSNSLNTYYDSNYIKYYKLTDLSGNENHGEIVNCEIVDLDIPKYTEVKIPYRRKSLFRSLKHDENGFDGQKWKDKHTRYNQLRFVNEVSNHISLINRDGLSTLNYILYGKTQQDKIIHINVGI